MSLSTTTMMAMDRPRSRIYFKGLLEQEPTCPTVYQAYYRTSRLADLKTIEVLGFKCALVNGTKPDESNRDKEVDTAMIVFTTSTRIAKISLAFVQWRDKSWAMDTPWKRVVKVSLSKVATVRMPLVGKLGQPFD